MIKAAFTWDRSVWNRYEIRRDKPCVYTGSGGSGMDRIYHLVPNGPSCEGDYLHNWTHLVPDGRLCGTVPSHLEPFPCEQNGSVPQRIRTTADPIPNGSEDPV